MFCAREERTCTVKKKKVALGHQRGLNSICIIFPPVSAQVFENSNKKKKRAGWSSCDT